MSHKPETLALHAGWRADPATGAVAVPIYQTTSYQFQSSEHAANLFALKEFGNIYTRIMNPTNDVLEKRIAALEGGVAALALASGQAASVFALQNLASVGDNIVSSTDLYGGTWNLFANTLKDQGIEVRFVDPDDPENFARATDDRTRAYYAETLPNPKLIAFPIGEVATIGRRFGIPLDHGQYRRAHPDSALRSRRGGHRLFVDQISRRPRQLDRRPPGRQRQLPWEEHNGRQPALNTPDPSYHGAIWTEAVKPLGPIAYIIKARVTLLRDLGSGDIAVQRVPHAAGRRDVGAADGASLRQRVRRRGMARQTAGGDKSLPSLAAGRRGRRSAPRNISTAGRAASSASSSRAGKEAGRKFIDALKLFYHVANIGDARSLVIHPASTTHSQLVADGAARDRRDRGLRAPVDRHRAYRRHPG